MPREEEKEESKNIMQLLRLMVQDNPLTTQNFHLKEKRHLETNFYRDT